MFSQQQLNELSVKCSVSGSKKNQLYFLLEEGSMKEGERYSLRVDQKNSVYILSPDEAGNKVYMTTSPNRPTLIFSSNSHPFKTHKMMPQRIEGTAINGTVSIPMNPIKYKAPKSVKKRGPYKKKEESSIVSLYEEPSVFSDDKLKESVQYINDHLVQDEDKELALTDAGVLRVSAKKWFI